MSKQKVMKSYAMNVGTTQRNILQSLNEERKENGPSSCEVILLTNGIKHFAHKIVLVTCSDFFRLYFETKSETTNLLPKVMFEHEKLKKLDEEISTSSEYESSEEIENTPKTTLERSKTVIPLPGIRPEEISIILEYMYTSRLSLTAENVNEILLVACLLQITFVIEFCAEVLIKQPNWRSPLVSPKLLNFVKNKTSIDNVNVTETSSDLSTAGTRTANSARKSSFELNISQSQSLERLDESNVISNNRRILRVRSKQAMRQIRNESMCRSKKYRQFKTSNKNEDEFKHGGFNYNTINEYSSSESGPEITIDAEEPKRKQIKDYQFYQSNENVRAMKAHSFSQFPNTTITNTGHRAKVMSFQKSPSNNLSGIAKQGKSYWGANANMATNRIQSDGQFLIHGPLNRSIPMFPQISNCSRTLAAAYASTLGVSTLNQKYFGFPIVNPLIYPTFRQTTIKKANTKQKLFGSDTIKQIPINRYSGSVTAFRVHPGQFQNCHISDNLTRKYSPKIAKQDSTYQSFTSNDNFSSVDRSQFASETKLKMYNLTDKETACAQSLLDLTYTPRVKHFSPSIVQKEGHETQGALNNSDISDENNLSNRNVFTSDNVKKQDLESITTATLITDHKTDIKSDNMKAFQKDYHTRKRKLLLAARNSDSEQNKETGSKQKIARSAENICPEKNHYSSVNDTDACETLKSLPKTVSGRPVSA